MRRLLLAAALLLAATGPGAAQDEATVLLSREQALRLVFPDAPKVVELRHLLTAQETAAIEATTGSRLEEGGFFLYADVRDGSPADFAVVVAEIGKVRPITHIVEVRPDGRCGRVAVMIYRETHGMDVASSRFTAQYSGKSLADPIRVDRDIINVAGSTLSAHAICRGVRKALAVVKVVALDRDASARAALFAEGKDVTPGRDERGGAAAPAAAVVHVERPVMGTIATIEIVPRAGGPDAAALTAAAGAALDEITHWDDVLSDWRAETPLSQLNAAPVGQAFKTGPDLLAWLQDADHWVAASDGAFDPTVGALVDAWQLRGPEPARPSEAAQSAARAAVGWRRLRVDAVAGKATRTVEGQRLDPGASGKGWALDRAAEKLRAADAVPALLSFRSTLLAIGAPPGEPGFPVDVVHDGAGRMLTRVVLHDAALSVSGGRPSGFRDGSVERGDHFDPGTGLPLPAARLAWVTHASAAGADALSTALLVRGVTLHAVEGASGALYEDAAAAPVAWPPGS